MTCHFENRRSRGKKKQDSPRYYNKEGKLLPGVTTILGVLNKPALVSWANNLGLAGINVREYVDTLALVGTIGHDMVMHHNKGTKFDGSIYPDELINKAENCFLSYLHWEKQHKVEPILCEAAANLGAPRLRRNGGYVRQGGRY